MVIIACIAAVVGIIYFVKKNCKPIKKTVSMLEKTLPYPVKLYAKIANIAVSMLC